MLLITWEKSTLSISVVGTSTETLDNRILALVKLRAVKLVARKRPSSKIKGKAPKSNILEFAETKKQKPKKSCSLI